MGEKRVNPLFNNFESWKKMIINPYRFATGGGVDLTTNLFDWWENGNNTGLHNATVIGDTISLLGSGVGPFTDAWITAGTLDCDEIFGGTTVNPAGPYTVALIVRNHTPGINLFLFQTSGGSDSLSAATSTRYWSHGGAVGTASDVDNFECIVATKSSAGLRNIYVNGTKSVGSTNTSATSWFKAFHTAGYYIACCATASREWGQDDVNYFYNSGNFRAYASI